MNWKFLRKNFKGKSGYKNPINLVGGETHENLLGKKLRTFNIFGQTCT